MNTSPSSDIRVLVKRSICRSYAFRTRVKLIILVFNKRLRFLIGQREREKVNHKVRLRLPYSWKILPVLALYL